MRDCACVRDRGGGTDDSLPRRERAGVDTQRSSAEESAGAEAFLEKEASELAWTSGMDLGGQAGMGHVDVRKEDTAEKTLRIFTVTFFTGQGQGDTVGYQPEYASLKVMANTSFLYLAKRAGIKGAI